MPSRAKFSRAHWAPFALVVALLLLVMLSGCGPTAHEQRVAEQRARLPFTSRVSSSESMKGFVPGDRLLVTAKPFADLRIGDPVFFWSEDKPIPTFHYIVNVGMPEASIPPRRRWITKGDNNQFSDRQLLSESTYIGIWTKHNSPGK